MKSLNNMKLDLSDENTGVAIVRSALEFPMRMIAENAGKDGAVIVEEVRRMHKSKKNLNIGYDVMLGEYVDMYERGIIDPVKVTRSAVENAASIAAMILTTEALITDIPEKRDNPPPQMPEY
jgi:chaperonin GroEL